MKKIIIVSSHQIFGGTIVLSLLCKLLCEKGIDSKMFYVNYFPNDKTKKVKFWTDWFKYSFKYHIKYLLYRLLKHKLQNNPRFAEFTYFPITGLKEKILPFFSKKNTIVVYPEVVYGNFLRAKNVVRWLLYYNKWQGSEAFGKNDIFICYRKIFNDWALNPKGSEIRLFYFDTTMYRKYNYSTRTGNCYIIRKGGQRKDLPKEFDGPIINYGMREEDIVEIFNRCEYCYSYDTQTFYNKIAAVCGCVPIVVLEPGKSKRDYLDEMETQPLGVAYGDTPDEINYAVSTRPDLLQSLECTMENDRNVEKFIKLLNEKYYE